MCAKPGRQPSRQFERNEMATFTGKKCDVTGGVKDVIKDVGSYAVYVYLTKDDADDYLVIERDLDLCPAGLRRLVKFIERGTTPPTKRKETADTT